MSTFFRGVVVIGLALSSVDGKKCKKDLDCLYQVGEGCKGDATKCKVHKVPDQYCIGWPLKFGSKYNGHCGGKASGISACSRDLECKSGHCQGGYCLDVDKECKDDVRKPGCSFEIELDRSNGDEMGIVVSQPSEVIDKIDNGLVTKWNDKHPKQQVKKGDRIVSVNGIKFWKKGMLLEAQQKKVLKIVLNAGAPAPKSKEKWEIQGNNLRVGGGDHSTALVASLALGACAFIAGAAILVQRRRSAQEVDEESACE